MQSVQLQHVFYKFIKVELNLQLHIQESLYRSGWIYRRDDLQSLPTLTLAHHLKTCLDFDQILLKKFLLFYILGSGLV